MEVDDENDEMADVLGSKKKEGTELVLSSEEEKDDVAVPAEEVEMIDTSSKKKKADRAVPA